MTALYRLLARQKAVSQDVNQIVDFLVSGIGGPAHPGIIPAATPATLGGIFQREKDPRTYGAVLDGASHPLSSLYPTLTAARLVFPFATDLAQELDYCGIQKAINVALGTEASPAPSIGDPAYPTPVPTRTATANVRITGPSAKINSPINIVSASGLVLHAPGVRFIPANAPGGSTLSSVFHWDGVADCAFSDLQVVAGDGTEAITEVFSYQWTGSAAVVRSSTHVAFSRCGVQGARYITGWAVGTSSGALQVDQSSWYDCCITGDGTTPQTNATYYQDGWKLGSGTSGNIIGLGLHNCQSFWNVRGINVAESKGVYIGNMTLQGNAKDYQIASEDAVIIDEGRSEGAGMFMSIGTGPTASSCMVTVRNMGWSAAHTTDDGTGHYKWAECDWAGMVHFDNCRIEGNAPGGIVPYIQCNPDNVSNSGLAALTVLLDMQYPNTPQDFARGNSNVRWVVRPNTITNSGSGFTSGGVGTPTQIITGKQHFGTTGTSGMTVDNANLYRGATNQLQSDGGLQLGGNLMVSGTVQPVLQPVIVAQQNVGGTDEVIAANYEAQQFTPGATVVAGTGIVVDFWAKAVAANSDTACAVSIWTNVAGAPGVQIASNAGALHTSGLSTGAFTQVHLATFAANQDLVAGTPYWFVIHLGAGFTVDSTLTVGTGVVSTSPDAVTWTAAGGTKSLRYLVETKTATNLVGSATYGIPVAGSTAAYQAVSGTSTFAQGVTGTSTHGPGVQGISTANFGVQGASTWSDGGFMTSTQGIGGHAAQTGSLVANTSQPVLLAERTGTANGHTYSGPTAKVSDAPSDVNSTTNLLELWSKLAGVSAVRVKADQGGLLTTGGVATKTKAGTPVDADFQVTPPDGTIVVDTTASKIWCRVGSVWKGAALT